MSSSIPSRSIDPDPNLPDTQFHSLSLSSSSGASNSASKQRLSGRSRTPKQKRKNRSTPYSSPALSRASQSRKSSITADNNNQDFDDNVDISLTDVNIVHISTEQNQINEEHDAFEKSSDDEKENNKSKTKRSDHLSLAELKSHFIQSENNKFTCNLCGESKTTNGSSTYNLRRHLAIRHQIDVDSNLSFEKKKKTTSENHPIISSERREEIDTLVLKCIIHGGLPFNHFSHPWYDALFEKLKPGYHAPDRRTLKTRIHDQYNEYIKELKRLLPKDRPVAYTTDIWKGPKRDSYICLTAHVFNDKLQPVSLLLSFRRLTDRKLSINLNAYITYELNRFGLSDCSHAGITTDNASDIKAATANGKFGPRIPCVAHTINLVVHHGLCIWEKPDETKYPFKPYQKNVTFDDDNDDREIEFIDVHDNVEDEILDAEQTFAQIQSNKDKQSNENDNVVMSLNVKTPSPDFSLVLLDDDEFISDCDELNDSCPDISTLIDSEKKQLFDILYRVNVLLIRIRRLVGITRSVSAIDEYVRKHSDGPANGFIFDIRIRWNSTFYMLNRLIHHQVVVQSLFIHKFPTITPTQRSSLAAAYVSHGHWDIMHALHDVLEPFELATRSLSGKHYATLALAYTTINIIRFGLKSKETDSPYLALLKKSVRAQFELYFDVKMTKQQKELMLVASFLDPETYRQLNREDKQIARTIIPNYMKKEPELNMVSSPSASSITETSQSLTEKLKIMVGMPTNEKSSKSITTEDELVLFSQAIQFFKGDFSSFWLHHCERFPRLFRVAQRVNIIPATSVPSESVFSVAGYIQRKQRTSLSSKSLRYLMVLKESYRLDELRSMH